MAIWSPGEGPTAPTDTDTATGVEGRGPSKSADIVGKEEVDPLLRLSKEEAPVTSHLIVLPLYSP